MSQKVYLFIESSPQTTNTIVLSQNVQHMQGCVCGVCRVPSTLRPILGNSTAPKDELYNEQDVQAALLSYAAANDLQRSNDSLKLDKLMVSSLFNKKEPQMEGDACPVEHVMKRLLGTQIPCSLYWQPWHLSDIQEVHMPSQTH